MAHTPFSLHMMQPVDKLEVCLVKATKLRPHQRTPLHHVRDHMCLATCPCYVCKPRMHVCVCVGACVCV